MIILQPRGLCWIKGVADDPHDLCAHGDVVFQIGKDVLLETKNERLTVSATALYLLRSITRPHTLDMSGGENLFPCCGFNMFAVEGEQDVVITGCPNGFNFEILHPTEGEVLIRAADGRTWHIGLREWRQVVFSFADEISDFYAVCAVKNPDGAEDIAGFEKFKSEWKRRRGRPLGKMSIWRRVISLLRTSAAQRADLP